MSWDANAVPTVRAKKAVRLRTAAVIFFIAISYGLDWYTNRIRETLEQFGSRVNASLLNRLSTAKTL
jgi:hypothetical protein